MPTWEQDCGDDTSDQGTAAGPATVVMPGIFPRHWDGGDFKGRQYAMDAWPNPLAQVPYRTWRSIGGVISIAACVDSSHTCHLSRARTWYVHQRLALIHRGFSHALLC